MPTKPVIAVTLSSRELPRLVHWRRMFEGLHECGAIPMAVDCGVTALDISTLLAHVDGLVLSGGGDIAPTLYGADPHDPTVGWVNAVRDRNELAAYDSAWRRGIPTLAICRGAQLVNAARGGTLFVDLTRDRPSEVVHRRTEQDLLEPAHRVDIAAGSRLSDWLGTHGAIAVNSQHHQGIRHLAGDFTATAHAEDGLVEAFEADSKPLTAVQWHPEIDWSTSPTSRRLLAGFIATCLVRGGADHAALDAAAH